MAERLLQIVVPSDRANQVRDILASVGVTESRHDVSDDMHEFMIRLAADRVEALLDPLEGTFNSVEGFQVFVLRLEAALPRLEAKKEKDAETEVAATKKVSSRISREELYTNLSGRADSSKVFIAMVVLSTIVAAAGLSQSNSAIVIGAMVMAPLLGPNMALSLATTLGDTKLALRALGTNLVGFFLASGVALIWGLCFHIDPTASEIVSRTTVGPTDLFVALAAGVAGALAFTSGVSASIVGVMVAVALLPPLVVCIMFLAGGFYGESMGALLLLGCNVISVNLAGVATFLVQGVSPRTWWDAERSKRMTRRALILWIALLALAIVLVFVSRLGTSS